MKFKFLNAVFAVIILSATIFSGSASAGLITLGPLSANEDGSGFITDSLNNREWTRWNQTLNLTLAELQAELTPGGRYEGWSLAGIEDMYLLENALLKSATCTWMTSCRMDKNDLLALFGKESPTSSSTVNSIFFLSDNDVGTEVGIMWWNYDSYIKLGDEWASIADADSFYFRRKVGFQLYRELNIVPEPSTLAILSLSLLGLTARRFKKH
ncbi:PEP-CTERM sorting domain-containing protein [Thalassomonas actiniarum]|uniref:PEP-CTERM sorting domain-containing protein n=1 Tax=Thalassomonas actiniarum TaxID=485447 RepID=UPI0005CE5F88|nr:PEP-CTERM sorting domain-containing protein [Thalassomonas actiniarum]